MMSLQTEKHVLYNFVQFALDSAYKNVLHLRLALNFMFTMSPLAHTCAYIEEYLTG